MSTSNPGIKAPEKSALFSKLEAFLPQIEKANEEMKKEIQQNGPDQFLIEKDEEEEKVDGKQPMIEMNFALGSLEESDKDDKEEKEIQFKSNEKALNLKLPGAPAKTTKPLIQELQTE